MLSPQDVHPFRYLLGAAACCAIPTPVLAQDGGDAEQEEQSEAVNSNDIVVTGIRVKGGVITDVPPVEELDSDDVQALGASSLEEVVAAIAPQSTSGRGRGSGRPIFLLNGQRISSFRALRDLPPEAIRRVQIFPEEVALQYGFRPEQRVINFILVENFASFVGEIEYGLPQDGGFSTNEFENTFTRIGKNYRLVIDLEYSRRSILTEDERDILVSPSSRAISLAGTILSPTGGEIDPALTALAGSSIATIAVPAGASPSLADFAANQNAATISNIGNFRSLSPENDTFEINASFSRSLAPQTSVTLNVNYELSENQTLLGLPNNSFILPSSNPASPFADDVILNRFFLTPRALGSDTTTHTSNFDGSFNHLLGGWRWTLTANFNRVLQDQIISQNADFSGLQAGLNDGSQNPFAADFEQSLAFLAPDISEFDNRTLAIRNSFSGELFRLPAGPVRVTLGQNYTQNWLDSSSTVSGITSISDLQRRNINATGNIELPIIEGGVGALGFLGDFSLNGNVGYSDLSDFGGLQEYGLGMRWEFLERLTFQASYNFDEEAPGIGNLGNPVIVTPNVTFFDLARDETVFLNIISGGNPDLLAETRRDIKLSLNWRPAGRGGPTLQTEFFRNRSRNVTADFPLLTPEIEAAFPGRVQRDTTGQLISVDQRSVTYDSFNSKSLRSGISWSGRLGSQRRGRPPAARRGPPQQNPNASASGDGAAQSRPAGNAPQAGRPAAGGRPAAARGRGRGGRGFGGRPSRWFFSLFHTYTFEDEILIRPGVPELDRLNGSAATALGGTPKHKVELSGGLFHKGMGFRLIGDYQSATTILGSDIIGNSDLRFSDRVSMRGFFFVNLDQRGNLTKKFPFLKGSRIRLRVDNIFNDFIRVRDEDGNRPFSFQRGFIDPTGRFFELSFRKRF